MDDYFISLKNIDTRPIVFEHTLNGSELVDLSYYAARFAEDVTIHGQLSLNSFGLQVELTVMFSLKFACHRCGKTTEKPFTGLLSEVYPDDSDALDWSIDGGCDLLPLINETLLNAIPSTLLCKDDCLGRCPVCGGDKNEKNCNCTLPPEEEQENPFAILGELDISNIGGAKDGSTKK